MRDPETGRMIRAGNQRTVAATFRHDTSRNLDPQLHTHAVLANMVQGGDGKWRTMANEALYRRQKLIGMVYRSELAQGLARLGYAIEKSHADGRFKIAGVPRKVIEAYSTRRAEIEAAVAERGAGETADNQRLAERAALMTRAHKRDVDKASLRESWQRQAAGLGFDARALVADARCCFADSLITDFPDYLARWVRGFPTVLRDRRTMGRRAGCRTGVGVSRRLAAPALRCGLGGDPPATIRRSASMATSAAFGPGPNARRLVVSGA